MSRDVILFGLLFVLEIMVVSTNEKYIVATMKLFTYLITSTKISYNEAQKQLYEYILKLTLATTKRDSIFILN